MLQGQGVKVGWCVKQIMGHSASDAAISIILQSSPHLRHFKVPLSRHPFQLRWAKSHSVFLHLRRSYIGSSLLRPSFRLCFLKYLIYFAFTIISSAQSIRFFEFLKDRHFFRNALLLFVFGGCHRAFLHWKG